MSLSIKKTMVEVLILSGLAMGGGLIVNQISSRGIAWIGEWDLSKGVVTAKAKNDVVVREREISLESAKQLYETHQWLWIDARDSKEFNEGHILGARSYPVQHFLEELLNDFTQKYSADTGIVVYCNGRECSDSHELAEIFREIGYRNVKVFVDGYPVWEEAGYAVEKDF